jgi:hypothetical protein
MTAKVVNPKPKRAKKVQAAVEGGQPVKNRVEVGVQPQASGYKAIVVDTKPGEVKFTDKIKAYYHTIIMVTGAILILANEVSPITESLPESFRHSVTGAIALITLVTNVLKSNEQWVNAL